MTATAGTLTPAQTQGLIRRLTALADDEIVLAHRGGEWTGHAPILEEDIALANIAQDELGHAGLYLGLRADLDGSDPDRLAFFRDAGAYTCTRLVELPKGDWAVTMLRQFLYDTFEALWLDAATRSTYAPLAAVAAKAVREEKFHVQHTALWVERLALGTEESARRIHVALAELWPHTAQLFQPVEGEDELTAAGLLPDLPAVHARWHDLVTRHLQGRCGLPLPATADAGAGRDTHTEHLAPLLAEMQAVARAHPDAEVW
ncbi:ring-1,2-phenylacetyl-CoA epoxidase subunit PaaC [Deinococcus metalli]|uniref:Phenylacetate-CoA oxygenase subunit PaaI n=1 Tax=Deinococcus metalli TaxID=1141878 RepID=A0A7W8KHK0_9DEIO|nr:1,2-phenylacetyl-CoA epoxidase subunit PaaC [Deinococcus metalli]MBB5378311.1 ring-1,2-phenylacetyl-CoA epoxidase subunit PaaC [Deinococcus metalli]GHF59805.1 phenylacetate-CoA oxygenase subunit PaaI [Deinococcus metalli]